MEAELAELRKELSALQQKVVYGGRELQPVPPAGTPPTMPTHSTHALQGLQDELHQHQRWRAKAELRLEALEEQHLQAHLRALDPNPYKSEAHMGTEMEALESRAVRDRTFVEQLALLEQAQGKQIRQLEDAVERIGIKLQKMEKFDRWLSEDAVTLEKAQEHMQTELRSTKQAQEERMMVLRQSVEQLERHMQRGMPEDQEEEVGRRGSEGGRPKAKQPLVKLAEEAAEQVAEQASEIASVAPVPEGQLQGLPTTYALQPSTWELPLILGTKKLGLGASLATILLLTTTVLVQVGFIILCALRLSNSRFDDDMVAELGALRLDLNQAGNTAVLQKLCARESSLQVAGLQVGILTEVENYLQLEGTRTDELFNGESMSLLALLVWTLVVAVEVRRAVDVARAASFLPLDVHTVIAATSGKLEDGVELKSISHRRLLTFVLLTLARFLIAIGLLVVGSFWLANDPDSGDLLLNSIALQFILRIDLLIAGAGLPETTRHLLDRLQPLSQPAWQHCHGAEMRCGLTILLVPVYVAMMLFTVLASNVETMEEARQALCGAVATRRLWPSHVEEGVMAPLMLLTGGST